ncbi:hypothetical protein ACOMHN_010114 [Nucella lapillus]
MAGSGKAGASSPSPPSPPSVAGAARGPQSGDVTSGGDGRCPHGGGVASGSGRHGSATVSGGSPRCDVGRPTDSDGRATRGQGTVDQRCYHQWQYGHHPIQGTTSVAV